MNRKLAPNLTESDISILNGPTTLLCTERAFMFAHTFTPINCS